MKSIGNPFMLLFFFSFTALGAQSKVERIENLLLFYPENGERELLLYTQQNKPLSETEEYKIRYLKGLLEYKKSNVDSAIIHLKESLLYFIKIDNNLYIAKTQLILGLISEKIGDFDMALMYYNDIIEKIDNCNKRELGSAYLGIAICNMYKNGIRKGDNPELEKGVKLLRSIGKKEYDLYTDYVACVVLPQENCKPQLKEIAQAYESMGIKNYATSVYKSLAHNYLKENQSDSARYYAEYAIPLTQNAYPSASLAPSLYHIIGITDVKRNDYISAERNYRHALKLCDSLVQTAKKYYVYKSIAILDSIRGNMPTSQYNMMLAYKAKANSSNIKIGYKYMVKDLIIKIDRLKFNLEKKALYTNILILAILATVTMSFFTVVFIRKKNRVEILKREKKAIEYILVHLKKSEVFNVADAHIEEIINNVAEPIPHASESFETAYSDLIAEFKHIFEQLSEGEIRYAVMVYIGLSNEVIANIKQVQVESVRKTKRRIRERLSLKTGTDLQKHFKQVLAIKNNVRKFDA